MATMEELFESAGLPWVELSPEEQFASYATQQFRPADRRTRRAFWGLQDPLMQQYYLNQPLMTTPGQEYGSFADYMTQVGESGYQAPSPATFGVQARQAATMAGLTPGQFFQYVDPQTDYTGPAISPGAQAQIEALSPAQQLMYRQTYGTGAQAAQNQLALASLLARQRTGGGMYGGQYGSAIESAMGELSGQLLARDPEANFLDWYLKRTPVTGAGGLTQQ
jgi:hypothetical protein